MQSNMLQNMGSWVVPKKGSAAASSTTKITMSLIDDVLKGTMFAMKKAYFGRLFIQTDAEIDGKLIIADKTYQIYCISPNFTDVISLESALSPFGKRIFNDVVLLLIESNAATVKYSAKFSGGKEE